MSVVEMAAAKLEVVAAAAAASSASAAAKEKDKKEKQKESVISSGTNKLSAAELAPAKLEAVTAARSGNISNEEMGHKKKKKKKKKKRPREEGTLASNKESAARRNDEDDEADVVPTPVKRTKLTVSAETDDNASSERVKCRSCRNKKKQKKSENENGGGVGRVDYLQNPRQAFASSNSLDFDLPKDFCPPNINVSLIPMTKAPKKRRRPARDNKLTPRNKVASPKLEKKAVSPLPSPCGKELSQQPETAKELGKMSRDEDEFKVFRPTCSRLVQYDPTKKVLTALHSIDMSDDLNNRMHISRRSEDSDINKGPAVAETKKANSRAARASQRRMLKDVASFGATTFGVDTLSGRDREQSIRFGRSGIHAWGVFADEEIKAGDMIVEYRGVLIGNKVAEKREKEYEKAKIGSDYMFRIDDEIVCDATYQGNVARFINASCDPNCFTQIITISGSKRIVIYAKRDIRPGEELVYDYKFPIEYDEKKRIPCHCGAANCKGFMNWDKRYVLIPPKDGGHQQEAKMKK